MDTLNTDLTALIILELTNKLRDNEMCHDPVLDDSVNLVKNYQQYAIGVNVSEQLIRNRLHDGDLRTRRPLVNPVLTS